MLRATIELWPHGDWNSPKTLAVIAIGNDGTAKDKALGNYDVTVTEENSDGAMVHFKITDHMRKHGSVSLLRKALERWEWR